MKFIKMEGIGNDFIVTHEVSPDNVATLQPAVANLCDRRRGIGGDGVIFVLPSTIADFRMRIFNSDGSEAEMCGNGIRCFVKYCVLASLGTKKKLAIETLAGTIYTELLDDGTVRVAMGAPRLASGEIPVAITDERCIMYPLAIDTETFHITAVSMGNPHAVIYTDVLTDELVLGYGPKIEKHPLFPKKTNVEFVNVISPSEIRMRVWERGCGETEACGTGACAAVVSGMLNKKHGNAVTVHLPGGDLYIRWDGNTTDPVMMTGPARAVFSGVIDG